MIFVGSFILSLVVASVRLLMHIAEGPVVFAVCIFPFPLIFFALFRSFFHNFFESAALVSRP